MVLNDIINDVYLVHIVLMKYPKFELNHVYVHYLISNVYQVINVQKMEYVYQNFIISFHKIVLVMIIILFLQNVVDIQNQ
jgi:hypothetical protein